MGSSISESEAPRVVVDPPKQEIVQVEQPQKPPVEKIKEKSTVERVDVFNV